MSKAKELRDMSDEQLQQLDAQIARAGIAALG